MSVTASGTSGSPALAKSVWTAVTEFMAAQGCIGASTTAEHPTSQAIREARMRRLLLTSVLVATVAAPVLADEAPKKGSDADDAFVTGIRKLGVMSGEAFTCSNKSDQPQVGEAAIDLATQVSLHFGLKVAFIYSGAFGYGIGHDSTTRTALRRSRTKRSRPSIWSGEMSRRSVLMLAAVSTFATVM